MSPEKITVSDEYEITSATIQVAYPITMSEWERLKKKVGDVSDASFDYQSASFCLGGIAFTILATWGGLNVGATIPPVWVNFWFPLIGFIALGWAIACYLIRHEKLKANERSRQSIIEDMDALVEKYQQPTKDVKTGTDELKKSFINLLNVSDTVFIEGQPVAVYSSPFGETKEVEPTDN